MRGDRIPVSARQAIETPGALFAPRWLLWHFLATALERRAGVVVCLPRLWTGRRIALGRIGRRHGRRQRRRRILCGRRRRRRVGLRRSVGRRRCRGRLRRVVTVAPGGEQQRARARRCQKGSKELHHKSPVPMTAGRPCPIVMRLLTSIGDADASRRLGVPGPLSCHRMNRLVGQAFMPPAGVGILCRAIGVPVLAAAGCTCFDPRRADRNRVPP